MKCPHRLEPHQIQGLDFIHIFPVIQVYGEFSQTNLTCINVLNASEERANEKVKCLKYPDPHIVAHVQC